MTRPDAALASMNAETERDIAECLSHMRDVQREFDLMAQRAVDAAAAGVQDDVVLAWCRERIDIPDELPLDEPMTLKEMQERKRHNLRRYMRLVDATARAFFEKFLTGDVH